MATTAQIVARFANRLETFGFVYLLGGSFASSAWEQSRPTNDADFALWLTVPEVPRFLAVFDDPYHVSEDEVLSVIADTSRFPSFQVLDMEEAYKFDVFLAGRTSIDHEAQSRARRIEIGAGDPILTACPNTSSC